jgi:adenine-specific DNA-methyltransferase
VDLPRQYTRRNTSDFFIHKDLKGSLSRELDFYRKNGVRNLEELEATGEDLAEGWFQRLRQIRRIGVRIIEFLAQIEAFQKMLGEKKFLTGTFYVLAVGSIPEAFYVEIADNGGIVERVNAPAPPRYPAPRPAFRDRETQDSRVAFLKAHPSLPLDTRHFSSDFLDHLLARYDDLDEMTDGLLVHSENWQALNVLLEKYRERVKCVYIDPPYNTATSDFDTVLLPRIKKVTFSPE